MPDDDEIERWWSEVDEDRRVPFVAGDVIETDDGERFTVENPQLDRCGQFAARTLAGELVHLTPKPRFRRVGHAG